MQSPRQFPLLPEHHRRRPQLLVAPGSMPQRRDFSRPEPSKKTPTRLPPPCKNTIRQKSNEESQTAREQPRHSDNQPAATGQTLTISGTLPTTSKFVPPHHRCRFATPIPEPCFSTTPECCQALNSATNSGEKTTSPQTSRLRHFVKTPNVAPCRTDTRPQCA